MAEINLKYVLLLRNLNLAEKQIKYYKSNCTTWYLNEKNLKLTAVHISDIMKNCRRRCGQKTARRLSPVSRYPRRLTTRCGIGGRTS